MSQDDLRPGESCPREELLAAYLGQDLSPSEESELEQHLSTCTVCREALEANRAVGVAIRALPLPEPSQEARSRAYAAVMAAMEAAASPSKTSAPAKHAAHAARAPELELLGPARPRPRAWLLGALSTCAAAACLVVVANFVVNDGATHDRPAERTSVARVDELKRDDLAAKDLAAKQAAQPTLAAAESGDESTSSEQHMKTNLERLGAAREEQKRNAGGAKGAPAPEQAPALDHNESADGEDRKGDGKFLKGDATAPSEPRSARASTRQDGEPPTRGNLLVLARRILDAARESEAGAGAMKGGRTAGKAQAARDERPEKKAAEKAKDSPASKDSPAAAAEGETAKLEKSDADDKSRAVAKKPGPAAPRTAEGPQKDAGGGAPAGAGAGAAERKSDNGARRGAAPGEVTAGDGAKKKEEADSLRAREGEETRWGPRVAQELPFERPASSRLALRWSEQGRVAIIEREGESYALGKDTASGRAGIAAVASGQIASPGDPVARALAEKVLDLELGSPVQDLAWARRVTGIARFLGLDGDIAELEKRSAKEAAPAAPAAPAARSEAK